MNCGLRLIIASLDHLGTFSQKTPYPSSLHLLPLKWQGRRRGRGSRPRWGEGTPPARVGHGAREGTDAGVGGLRGGGGMGEGITGERERG
jgi:hypothetical protein